MHQSEFDSLIEAEAQRLLDLNHTKGKEYTPGEDVLGFLKERAAETGTTPHQVFAIFAAKHWHAILDHVKDPRAERSEPIEGRIRDLQLYLHLYHALIKDEEVPF